MIMKNYVEKTMNQYLEEKFVELMPEFAYTKVLLDNYRSSIRFNF